MGSARTIPATFAAEAEEWLERLSTESVQFGKLVVNGQETRRSADNCHPHVIHSLFTA
jgi:hypothetical protein